MKVYVEVWDSRDRVLMIGRRDLVKKGRAGCIAAYTVDHNNESERRVLGEQVRNAFEGGQCVLTYPVP